MMPKNKQLFKILIIMSKNNFSRSNVNEQTLNISMPEMSSFNLSHNVTLTPRMGQITPINYEPLIPRDTISGSLNPQLQLEKIVTPSIGRVRMDTHTFVVNQNRINRDWKFYVEGKSGYSTKSSFLPNQVFGTILSVLCGQTPATSLVNWSFALTGPTATVTLKQALESGTRTKDVLCQMVKNAIAFYGVPSAPGITYPFGYNADFCKEEMDRLNQYLVRLQASSTWDLADVWLNIMKPWFGEGSLMDMFGYPIFEQYSRNFEGLKGWYTAQTLADQSMPDPDDFFGTVTAHHILCFWYYDAGDAQSSFVQFKYKDESPLRAYYAVWFDYFRNFHVEKSANILDPDTFDHTSLISTAISKIAANVGTDKIDYMNLLMTLLIPRRRNFARDIITTIQVEDIYRFVYTPWLSTTDGSVDGADDGSNPTAFYDSIDQLLIGTVNVQFPNGTMNGHDQSETVTTLRADLQTMRRSGMLEKLLAREYYYPDTYAGRMLAHYGIKPGDIDMMNSVYLSGSEQFISGNQEIANVGTSEMPAGTRTMVGGVESTDSFSYTANDHCILISVLSLVPMVNYDACNPHLDELVLADLPLPQFASDTRVITRLSDLLRSYEQQTDGFGYVPRYYSYRIHGDETHGKYITDYRAYNFMRDYYNMSINGEMITLSPYFLRVNVSLDAFLGLHNWDSIAFGNVDIKAFVTRALPAAIEFI